MGLPNRKEKLQDFYDFCSSAIQEGKTGPIREYIIRRSSDPAQADRALEILLLHGIEVKQAQSSFEQPYIYFQDKPETIEFQSGDYIIPLDQPLKRLIQVMFEKESLLRKVFWKQKQKDVKKTSQPNFMTLLHGQCRLPLGWMHIGHPQTTTATQPITSRLQKPILVQLHLRISS